MYIFTGQSNFWESKNNSISINRYNLNFSTLIRLLFHFSLMKRKCNFRRRTNTICEDRTAVKGTVAPEVSKNQGSFQGILWKDHFSTSLRN